MRSKVNPGLFIFFLLLVSACGNPAKQAPAEAVVGTSDVPSVISYQLVNIYPHDPSAFTEGLQFVNGYLYESSGEYGVSDLRKTELETGKVLQKTKMDKQYFGEGITILNGKIYQLTYREKTGFIYELSTLKPIKKFSFNTSEGWGMTNDGKHLIFDDGSNKLYYLDTATLMPVKELSVTDEHGAVENINELEFIKGYIYANQWQTDKILKIDTGSGKVVARADLSDLRSKMGISPYPPTSPKAPEVLNGIAYDAANNRIFITGKYWPKLAEVKLDN